MFPKKHFKDLESSSRREFIFAHTATALLFITSFLAIGPLIHEMSHIILLEIINCSYNYEFGFTYLNGLYAVVKPLCTIDKNILALFYSVGYSTTLITGSTINYLGIKIERDQWGQVIVGIGTGNLLSILTTIGMDGDLQNFVEVLNLSTTYSFPIVILVIGLVLLSSFIGIKFLLKRDN